ncbi:unnamed protein product [Schistocephalus solidus]|uniref:GLOBIN domain-containing protein n=1 Tax=Schistocephalus solidus TaxID=70667 RepID=A0A183TC19_SCHSO|nr:unnamed protein product [Schistocephalus solidus]
MSIPKTSSLRYRQLFTKYPHYIRLFKRFRDLPNLDSIMQSAAFKAHAMRFIGAIDAIMENLDDESCLVELLKRLAEEHRPRGITENDFYVSNFRISPTANQDRNKFNKIISVSRRGLWQIHNVLNNIHVRQFFKG